MIKAESSQVVHCSIENAFSYIAINFFENYSKWNPAIIELEKTSQGAIQFGTTGRQMMDGGGWQAESKFHVTDWESLCRFSITSLSKPYFKTSYFFEPIDSHTKLTYVFEFSAGRIGRLFENFIAGSIHQVSQEIVANLKQQLEIKLS